MIPEEIKYNRQVQIHAELLRSMSNYINMMCGRETDMIMQKIAM